MKAWVYILTLANNHYYIGSTTNLKKRILQHQSGKSRYTKSYLPLELTFSIELDNYSTACIVERYLKKSKSRKLIIEFVNSPLKIIKHIDQSRPVGIGRESDPRRAHQS